MRLTMFVRELETLEAPGMPAVLDRLEAGGVRSLVLGDLWFKDGTPGFEPDLGRYRGLSNQPPRVLPGAEGRVRLVASRKSQRRSIPLRS